MDETAQDTAQVTVLPMECDCGGEGREATAATRACAVTWMNWEHGCEITGICNDMWTRVQVTFWRGPRKGQEIVVDCDSAEDGIAAVVCHLAGQEAGQ